MERHVRISSSPPPPALLQHGPTKAVPPTPVRGQLPTTPPSPSPTTTLGREVAVRAWVERVTQTVLDPARPLCAALRSGIELCTLLNRIQPDLIKKVNRVQQPYLELENIGKFVLGARALGVPKSDMLQAADLYDPVNPGRIVSCLVALAKLAEGLAPALPRLDLDPVGGGLGGSRPSSKRTSLNVTLGGADSPAAMASHLRKRQSSVILARETEQLQAEKQQLERATAAQIEQLRQLQSSDRSLIDRLQIENERATLELDRVRTALKKAEVDRAIERKQAEADRILAMTEQQQAVQLATEQLERRLKAQHQRELDQMIATSKAALNERKRQMRDESAELETNRSQQLDRALKRIAELEQSQDQQQHGDEIARIRHEARVQIAVETERLRLEADQRALEQVRQQAEQARRQIADQVTDQCQLELDLLNGQIEADVIERTSALQAESQERERQLRRSLEVELDALGPTLEQERDLRQRYEAELGRVRADLDRESGRVRDEQLQAQARAEAELRAEFAGELARLQDVLEQRLRSEERQRVQERQQLEGRYRAEAADLQRRHRELVQKQADLQAASDDERADVQRTIVQMQGTIRELEEQAAIRSAVEQERDRFMARVDELEREKSTSEAVYERRLREANEQLDRQRAALTQLQAELDHKLNDELGLMTTSTAVTRDDDLHALRQSQQATLTQYEAEIDRLDQDRAAAEPDARIAALESPETAVAVAPNPP